MKLALVLGLVAGIFCSFVTAIGSVLGFFVSGYEGHFLQQVFCMLSFGFAIPFLLFYPKARVIRWRLGEDPRAGVRTLLMIGTATVLYVGSRILLYHYGMFPVMEDWDSAVLVAVSLTGVLIGGIVASAVMYLIFVPKWNKEWKMSQKIEEDKPWLD